MNPDGTDQKVVVDQPQVFDYDWSPDSKWLVYARRDGSSASELYIVPAGGATAQDPARNVTRYATYNGDVTWSLDGKKIAFISERRGKNNLLVLNLQKPLAPGVAAPPSGAAGGHRLGRHPPADRHRSRRCRSTRRPSRRRPKVAFRGRRRPVGRPATNGGQMTRLTTGGQQPRMIQWSRKQAAVRRLRRPDLLPRRPGHAAGDALDAAERRRTASPIRRRRSCRSR